MILNETMNEIADAIREKTGKSEKIAPINFAEEIKGITAGGENTWRYFDCKQTPTDIRVDLLVELQSMIVKLESLSGKSIMSSAMMKYIEDSSEFVAFGADMSIETNVSGEFITLGQLYETVTDMLAQAGVVEITKEEFYSLE